MMLGMPSVEEMSRYEIFKIGYVRGYEKAIRDVQKRLGEMELDCFSTNLRGNDGQEYLPIRDTWDLLGDRR